MIYISTLLLLYSCSSDSTIPLVLHYLAKSKFHTLKLQFQSLHVLAQFLAFRGEISHCSDWLFLLLKTVLPPTNLLLSKQIISTSLCRSLFQPTYHTWCLLLACFQFVCSFFFNHGIPNNTIIQQRLLSWHWKLLPVTHIYHTSC